MLLGPTPKGKGGGGGWVGAVHWEAGNLMRKRREVIECIRRDGSVYNVR